MGVAPPWDPDAGMIPWTCKVLGRKQAVPTWKPSDATPSLYCFLVTLVHGYEPELLRYQLAKGIGIFGCNGFSVFSERQMLLGPAPNGSMVQSTAISGPMSTSMNNTYDFLRAWHKVATAGEFSGMRGQSKLTRTQFFCQASYGQSWRRTTSPRMSTRSTSGIARLISQFKGRWRSFPT